MVKIRSSYNKKVIIAGDVIEFFDYENPVLVGEKRKNRYTGGRSNSASDDDKKKNRSVTMQRARSTLRRLITANTGKYFDDAGRVYKPTFLTLTFAENIQNVKNANYEFKKFRQRLEYRFKIKLKYVVVTEFQKRGAVHYHVLFFNLPFVPVGEIADIWENGFVKINVIDNVDNIGAYVCKYMGKDLDDTRLVGEKCYFSSRGLLKPVELTNENEVNQLRASLPLEKMVYESSFSNEHLGSINYKQYNLKRQ